MPGTPGEKTRLLVYVLKLLWPGLQVTDQRRSVLAKPHQEGAELNQKQLASKCPGLSKYPTVDQVLLLAVEELSDPCTPAPTSL